MEHSNCLVRHLLDHRVRAESARRPLAITEAAAGNDDVHLPRRLAPREFVLDNQATAT